MRQMSFVERKVSYIQVNVFFIAEVLSLRGRVLSHPPGISLPVNISDSFLAPRCHRPTANSFPGTAGYDSLVAKEYVRFLGRGNLSQRHLNRFIFGPTEGVIVVSRGDFV